MEKVDVVVIGAGVIGLAVARALCMTGRSVVVVESHERPGMEVSSRNSGVIHSGIYYPTGSAKARLCTRGRGLLYDYCQSNQIPFQRCGKLIIAQAAEISKLEVLLETARRNGVTDLQWLDGAAVRQKEPVVSAAAALWSPSTGIVSVHELMVALHGEIENAGGIVAFRTTFLAAERCADGFRLQLRCGEESMPLACQSLVNSAGLSAPALLASIEGYPANQIPRKYFAKGSYFEFAGRSPFRQLIYPMPSEAGLGIHGTLDLAGRLRFGPDVEWIEPDGDKFDYTVEPERGQMFYAAIREYWPDLPERSLQPSYSGIRPKLAGPGSRAADFRVESCADHGVFGLINLLGIESPGLTASLAIGEEVARLLKEGG